MGLGPCANVKTLYLDLWLRANTYNLDMGFGHVALAFRIKAQQVAVSIFGGGV